jgi:hypothetical protein
MSPTHSLPVTPARHLAAIREAFDLAPDALVSVDLWVATDGRGWGIEDATVWIDGAAHDLDPELAEDVFAAISAREAAMAA